MHKTTLFEEYDSTYEWGKDRAYSNYKESENALTRRGTTVEEATNIYANNILKPVLDKAEFPIIPIAGIAGGVLVAVILIVTLIRRRRD